MKFTQILNIVMVERGGSWSTNLHSQPSNLEETFKFQLKPVILLQPTKLIDIWDSLVSILLLGEMSMRSGSGRIRQCGLQLDVGNIELLYNKKTLSIPSVFSDGVNISAFD